MIKKDATCIENGERLAERMDEERRGRSYTDS